MEAETEKSKVADGDAVNADAVAKVEPVDINVLAEGDFAAFEKARDGGNILADKSKTDTGAKSDPANAEADKTSDAEEEDEAEDDTQSLADKNKDNNVKKDGKKSDDPKDKKDAKDKDTKEGTKEGDLPAYAKKRLRRANAIKAEALAQVKQLSKELAEARAGGKPEADKKPDTKADAAVHADMPEEDDYEDSDKGREDYDKDTALWLDDKPYSKKSKDGKKPDLPKADKKPATDTAPDSDALEAAAEANELNIEIEEVLDGIDGDADLFEEFTTLSKANKILGNIEMMRWLAYEDDAGLVAQEFIKSPKKSRRIFRSPIDKQRGLMDEMLVELKDSGKKKPAKDKKPSGGNNADVPVVDDLNAKGTAATVAIQDMTMEAYTKLRDDERKVNRLG